MNYSILSLPAWFRYPPGALSFLPLVALLLGGCALLQPVDVDHRLYAAGVTVTHAVELATDLRKQGLIPDDDWPEVKSALIAASAAVDDGRALYKADPKAALDKLNSFEAILAELNRRLGEWQQQGLERVD